VRGLGANPAGRTVSHHIPIIPSLLNGQRGWLLRWREDGRRVTPYDPTVKLSHWFADVDEAMAVKLAMRRGQTFEQAHADLFAGRLNLDEATEARVQREHRTRQLARDNLMKRKGQAA
jgi:hypothetical protein